MGDGLFVRSFVVAVPGLYPKGPEKGMWLPSGLSYKDHTSAGSSHIT